MKPQLTSPYVLSWAHGLEQNTIDQAATTSRMPFVEEPLALMADAHLGKGSTIGSVIATRGAIIPAAVGVDIGCGMIAVVTSLKADDLPDDLSAIHSRIAKQVPAGIPNKRKPKAGSHKHNDVRAIPKIIDGGCFGAKLIPDTLDRIKVANQFGTLGSGNHFVELCLDEDNRVWIVLHSGSRGAGNKVATAHIEKAKGLMKEYFITLEDPELAYFTEKSEAFRFYIRDMLWAQDYAYLSREKMASEVLGALGMELNRAVSMERSINCHHNYTAQENHHGKNLWITRKGAIRARVGDFGVIPGSMATGSYIVEGLGNKASYQSASHGAGRTMSRTKARKNLTESSLTHRMRGVTWNNDPKGLLDEHPEAYKNLDDVMAAQADLVQITHKLTTILNYKGQ